MRTIPLFMAAAMLVCFACGSADAQPPAGGQPIRVRGTVRALAGDTLTVAARDGRTVAIALGPQTGVNGVERRSVRDIKDGTFIGTTASKGADGQWHATEVHIFPDSMRGAGEGHYAWDFPNTTMTNAAVQGTAALGHGRKLKLMPKGSPEVNVDVGRKTRIVALVPGDRSLLVPGAAVFVLGRPGAGGRLEALAVIAQKGKVAPPM